MYARLPRALAARPVWFIQRSMVGRSGGGGAGGGAATPWLGREPWYAASSEVDWLGACLAAEE